MEPFKLFLTFFYLCEAVFSFQIHAVVGIESGEVRFLKNGQNRQLSIKRMQTRIERLSIYARNEHINWLKKFKNLIKKSKPSFNNVVDKRTYNLEFAKISHFLGLIPSKSVVSKVEEKLLAKIAVNTDSIRALREQIKLFLENEKIQDLKLVSLKKLQNIDALLGEYQSSLAALKKTTNSHQFKRKYLVKFVPETWKKLLKVKLNSENAVSSVGLINDVEQSLSVYNKMSTESPKPDQTGPKYKTVTFTPQNEQKNPKIERIMAQVRLALGKWSLAWSSQNLDNYISSYSDKFKVPSRYADKEAWESSRRRVISRASKIRVKLKNVSLEFIDDKHVLTNFHQFYSANNYQDQSDKTVSLILESDGWKIIREYSKTCEHASSQL
ncbi:MAG: hypothetical protein ISR65_15760 [Bacteriovoracaceae bacterium]|nr:hypothetical protein [Bacteriovoracaceae bacterium]